MPQQITVQDLAARLAKGERIYLIDVRQPWEHEAAALPGTDLLLPLDQLMDRCDELAPPAGVRVVTYCHHGIRSLNAAVMLERLGLREVASLAGGIDRWSIEIDPTVPRY